MNWNDLAAAWKRQSPPQEEPAADSNALRPTFAAESRKLSRRLFWRDIREAVAGILLTAFFARVGWKQGRADWPFIPAILLCLGVTLFFIRERVRAHRLRVAPDAPLLAKLEADLAELRHQRQLLLNVAYLMAPIIGAWAIVLVTTVVNKPVAFRTTKHSLFLALYIAGAALLFGRVWVRNRRSARARITPRILELERMRDELLAPE